MASFQLASKVFQGARGLLGKKGLDVVQQGFTGVPLAEVPGFVRSSPLVAGGLGAGAVAFGKDVAWDPISEAVMEDPIEAALAQGRRARVQAEVDALTAAQLRQRMMESSAKLAALDPQMYNEVLAGRKLPRGAAVFGGSPRVDLMDQLSHDMATGAFQQPPNPDLELAQLLGVQ